MRSAWGVGLVAYQKGCLFVFCFCFFFFLGGGGGAALFTLEIAPNWKPRGRTDTSKVWFRAEDLEGLPSAVLASLPTKESDDDPGFVRLNAWEYSRRRVQLAAGQTASRNCSCISVPFSCLRRVTLHGVSLKRPVIVPVMKHVGVAETRARVAAAKAFQVPRRCCDVGRALL